MYSKCRHSSAYHTAGWGMIPMRMCLWRSSLTTRGGCLLRGDTINRPCWVLRGNCPDVFCEYVRHVDLKRKNYTDNWQKASLLNPKAQIIRVGKSSVLASLLRPIQHSLESFSNHNLSNKRHTTKLVFPQCRQGGTVSTEIIRLFHSSPHGSTFLVTSSAHTQRISH